MKNLLSAGLLGMTLGLSSCGLFEQTVNVVMTPNKVTLPERVTATADLTIGVEVIQGCATFDKVTVLERTSSALKLQVNGLEKRSCPAVPNAVAFDTTFVDKGTSARTNPFEVFVNGKSYGTVSVQ